MQTRTQIYLEPIQHAALLKESRRLGLSLAGMVRKLVEDHIMRTQRGEPSLREEKKTAALALIGLGDSGQTDVSSHVEAHLGKAIFQEILRDRRSGAKRPSKRKP